MSLLRKHILRCERVWNLFNLANAELFRYYWADMHITLALLLVMRSLKSPTPCVERLICAQCAT